MFEHKTLILIILCLIIMIELMITIDNGFEFYLWCIDECEVNFRPPNNRGIPYRYYKSCLLRCEMLLN